MPQNQHEMIQSAARDYAAADKTLNQVYTALIRALKSSPKRITQLRTAQKLWLQLRDAEAKFVALSNEGGSNEPLLLYATLARLTNDRVKTLQLYLAEVSAR